MAAAKVVLGATFGAAAAYGVYQTYKHQQVLQEAEEEVAQREEEHLQALQRLQEMMQSRGNRAKGKAGAKRGGSDPASDDHTRNTMLLRCKLFGEHLARLKERLQRAERRRGVNPYQRLIQVPVLGAAESTTVVLAAAICLWGDVMLFSKYLVDPYVQYEMQQDADGPEEGEQGTFDGAGCGQDAPLVDPADMLQFGFTLSQLSEGSCDVLERWLMDIASAEPLLGFEARPPPAVMSAVMHVLVVSQFKTPALVSVCRQASAEEVEQVLRLARALGLHVCKTSALTHTPRKDGKEGVHLAPVRRDARSKKAAKLPEVKDTEMWLANFPLEAGFDISKASIDAKARSWTYNMEGGVFCRAPDGFGTKPVLVDAGVTKEQRECREDVLVRERMAREAATLLRRLRGETTAAPTRAKGLKLLRASSLEHCIALSGELELYSQMLGSVDTNLLNMLREVDLHMLEMQQVKLVSALVQGLLDTVPPPEAGAAGLNPGQANSMLEKEVKVFVKQFIQMLRAKYWQTPLNHARFTPAELVPAQCLTSEATAGLYTDHSQTKMLRYKLTAAQQHRDRVTDRMAKVPFGMHLVVAAMVLALVACAHMVTCAAMDASVRGGVGAVLPSHVLGQDSVDHVAHVLCNALGLLVTMLSALPVLRFVGGWQNFAQMSYIFVSKQMGLRVPIVRDVRLLETQCKRKLQEWAMRNLHQGMQEHIDHGSVSSKEAQDFMQAFEQTALPSSSGHHQSKLKSQGHSGSNNSQQQELPGSVEFGMRFLALPVVFVNEDATQGWVHQCPSKGAKALADILNGSLHNVRHGETVRTLPSGQEAPAGPNRITYPADVAQEQCETVAQERQGRASHSTDYKSETNKKAASFSNAGVDGVETSTASTCIGGGDSDLDSVSQQRQQETSQKTKAQTVQDLLENDARRFVRGTRHMLLITPLKTPKTARVREEKSHEAAVKQPSKASVAKPRAQVPKGTAGRRSKSHSSKA